MKKVNSDQVFIHCCNVFTSMDNRFCGTLFGGRAIGHARNGHTEPKCMSDQETIGNIAFCTSLHKWDLGNEVFVARMLFNCLK